MIFLGVLMILIGFISLLVCIILFIIGAFKKNSKIKRNLLIFGVSFAFIIVGYILSPKTSVDNNATSYHDTQKIIKQNQKRDKASYSSDFDKLKKDMTIEKVEKVFGKPDELISDDIWQYNATDDDGIPQTIRIYFKNNQVSSYNLSYSDNKEKNSTVDSHIQANKDSSVSKEIEQLNAGLLNIEDKNNSYIVEIKQFSSKWDHIQIILSDNFVDLSTDGKEELINSISSDVRGIIGGYSNQNPTKIFFTFSNSDNETLAESSAFDVYNIKVK